MPPQKPLEQDTGGNDLVRIRTFQGDVEALMRKQPTSKAEIAIAENEKRIKQEKEAERLANAPSPFVDAAKIARPPSELEFAPRWNMKLIVLVAAGVLFVAGIGTAASFFFAGKKPQVVAPPKTEVPQSAAITLEEGESRAGTAKAIWNGIKALSVPQNELRTIPLKIGTTEATTEELFLKLETSAPSSLVRALGSTPIIGVHGFRGGQPFLLFSVSSYDFAFAGMLAWEPEMLNDIGPLFGISPREIVGKASSTTAEALTNTIAVKDVIIRNKDVRATFDPQGKIIFLYSFIDKQTLVITTNEDTLKALIGKAGGGRLR